MVSTESVIPNYFILNDRLYKKIRVVKSEDYVVAWSYYDERRMRFSYSGTRREAKKAFLIKEVSELIEWPMRKLTDYLDRGLIDYPANRLYAIKTKRPGQWMWSEDEVLELRDRLYSLARKNKYGEPYYGFKLISKADLIAKMTDQVAYYVKGQDGEFRKVWRAI